MLKFFRQSSEVLAVMSEKEDGSMKFVENSNLNSENREKFFRMIGINKNKVTTANQVHGGKAEEVSYSNLINIPEADALVTREKDIYLSISIADCIPVFFYEPQSRIVSIAHAGWRGIADDIIINTVNKIFDLGGNIKKINVALGPGINECHFEVNEEVVNKFKNYKEFISERNDKIFLDLRSVIKKQLNDMGVSPENIKDNNECTYCSNRLFSYRRDKPEVVQAMRAVIGLKII